MVIVFVRLAGIGEREIGYANHGRLEIYTSKGANLAIHDALFNSDSGIRLDTVMNYVHTIEALERELYRYQKGTDQISQFLGFNLTREEI